MQDPANELLRIPLPRTPVNRARSSGGRAVGIFYTWTWATPAAKAPTTYVPLIHTSRSGRTLLSVPPYATLDGFPKRRRLLAERLFELGVIHHEWFLELVEHLDRLADSWVEKTHSPQHHLRCRLDACRLADFFEDHLHELARCERLGGGSVPRLPKSLLAFSQDNQPFSDVGYVGVGVWLVGVPGYLGALALHGPAKDFLARSRHSHVRTEVVRCTPDRDPHLAAFVGLHQHFGHPGADRTFACVGSVGQVLGERTTIGRPVHVEILHRYELRPCARRSLQHSCLQQGAQLRPLVVGRIEGKVDDRSSLAGLSGEGLIRGVTSYDLHALGHAHPAAAVDHPDSPWTPLYQLVHYRHPHSPGAEDDVKLAVVCHPLFLLSLVDCSVASL